MSSPIEVASTMACVQPASSMSPRSFCTYGDSCEVRRVGFGITRSSMRDWIVVSSPVLKPQPRKAACARNEVVDLPSVPVMPASTSWRAG